MLGEKYGKDKIGLYRDDGWEFFGDMKGLQAERTRKEFISIFKTEFKLSIISETNLEIVNFSDVTMNQNTGTHEPYNKPNKNPLYTNKKSTQYKFESSTKNNEKTSQKRSTPKKIQKRISKLSISTRIFNNSKDNNAE